MGRPLSPSNFRKNPYIKIEGFDDHCHPGWDNISQQIKNNMDKNTSKNLTIDTYPGVDEEEVIQGLSKYLQFEQCIHTKDALLPEAEIQELIKRDLTDDAIFGKITKLQIHDFFCPDALISLKEKLRGNQGPTLIIGVGASLVTKEGMFVYADIARWEIQLRFRRETVGNIGSKNLKDSFSQKYKRAYFIDWRVADNHKKTTFAKWDYLLDTNQHNSPKLVTAEAYRVGMEQAINQPFSVVPFFDPGPWGGQWMREVCDLDPKPPNFAWCFNCVPEENSLLLGFGEYRIEVPSINLVFMHPKSLLGESVYGRFGTEFPIRFDFLDTMGGGNLSLQVHPLTEYIQQEFGMNYTQDESYYILDAEEGAQVYLGVKEDIDPDEMIQDLKTAQLGDSPFPAEKYIGIYPARKHDHFLIPAGTIHCSGAGSMVLEVSATPYIFTFKLWDWGRLGLDGKPRPINIERGEAVIQWDRSTNWVKNNLINTVSEIEKGHGYIEERTGLHPAEFIETRRHWFTDKVEHDTNGGVNVICLVEGDEVIVESPTNAFAPFFVNYCETFVVPAQVGAYTISPKDRSQKHATLKAYVRT